jgi:Ferredoxin-like domain in Api92-like protein
VTSPLVRPAFWLSVTGTTREKEHIMPNWTTNTIYANGSEKDIAAFIEAVKWQDQIFDFDRFIPMPELLKHTSAGSREIEGKAVKAWYVVDPVNPFADGGVRCFTPEEEAELALIGYSNWYDWSCAHWGTKWNACHAEMIDRGDGFIAIRFDTAWAAPLPIFEAMLERFPTITFECSWQDECENVSHSMERVAEEVQS